jgi:hypothetical protein
MVILMVIKKIWKILVMIITKNSILIILMKVAEKMIVTATTLPLPTPTIIILLINICHKMKNVNVIKKTTTTLLVMDFMFPINFKVVITTMIITTKWVT